MKAYIINEVKIIDRNSIPLKLVELKVPVLLSGENLIKISCCGICHTELDELEGRASPSAFPVIPGHQIIGSIETTGSNTSRFKKGDRVGVAWIFSACGNCEYCNNGVENLCAEFKGTGRDANGGYAEYIAVHEKFTYKIPEFFSDAEAAPLLCAGAIGYRSLKLSEIKNGQTLGLSGFGASAHLVLQMVKYLFPDSKIFVFARNDEEQNFARSLGAVWAGGISDIPPHKVHAIIDTTPVWKTVVGSMLHLKPGGRLIINAIRKEEGDKEELLKLNYQEHLWMEKEIKSVANITRNDVEEFLALAAVIPIKQEVQLYLFEQANEAIIDLKYKPIKGAKVLMMKK